MTWRVAGAWLLALLPVVQAGLYVGRHAVDVPVFDQWQVQVPVALRTAEGTLELRDLFAPYNEHRYVFTRLLTVATTLTTRWSLRAETYVNLALNAATLLLLLDLVRRRQPRALPIAAPVLAALVFSMRQQAIWLWSLMTGFSFVVLFVVAGVWTQCTRRPGLRSLAFAAACAVCATFSAAPGLLAWPVLGLAAWLTGRRRVVDGLLWLGASAAGLGLFFAGHTAAAPQLPPWPAAAGYALAFLGSPLVPESAWALPAARTLGLVALGAAVSNAAWLRRHTGGWEIAAPWAALAVLAAGAALLAAWGRVGRLDVNPLQPLRSRYVGLATPLWLGLFGLTMAAVGAVRRRAPEAWLEHPLVRFDLALLACLLPFYAVAAADGARTPVRATASHERCLRDFPRTRDASCLASIVYGVRAVEPRVDLLARHRLAAFATEGP